jgi:magnesium transporter
MSKTKKHRTAEKKVYTSPGSLIYVGKETVTKATAQLIQYNEQTLQEKRIFKFVELQPFEKDIDFTAWLNVDGLHDIKAVESFGKTLKLHPLILEDILNTEQKPKLEHYGNHHIFLVMKVLRYNALEHRIESEHLAMVLGENYVASFQESDSGNVFSPVEDRLKASIGKTRRNSADYLFYSLCDVIVDGYFVLMDELSDQLEDLEMSVIENPKPSDQKALYAYRRELLTIRKAVAPLRDTFSALIRDDSSLIRDSSNVYFRDIYDHVLQVLEIIDTHREMLENIQNIYLNSLSQKMNSVMKTLTVFTAIFMPLTFIVGIYGMNFDIMPELRNPNGYYYTLGCMGFLGLILWVYFKWKKYM